MKINENNIQKNLFLFIFVFFNYFKDNLNFYKIIFLKYYIKKFLKLNFNIFLKNKYIRSKNSYIMIKGYNLSIKKKYLSYNSFNHYINYCKKKIFLNNILNCFFVENSIKNIIYFFKYYYFKNNIFNKIFSLNFLYFYNNISLGKINILNNFFIYMKENFNKYVNLYYLNYKFSFNKNLLKFYYYYVDFDYIKYIFILKKVFKYYNLIYKYYYYDLLCLLQFKNKSNNFIFFDNSILLLFKDIKIYNNF
jgi:hypothetical protein